MRAHFRLLEFKFKLHSAKKVVFAGSSMGGFAVMFWIDYLKKIVDGPENVYGIIDSGIFVDPEQLAYLFFMNEEILKNENAPGILQ